MKHNPKNVFLAEVSKHTGLKESDFDTIVEYECKQPGKHKTAVVGEATCGKLFVAEDGFLRQYSSRGSGRWNCKVLGSVSFL